MSEVVAGIIRQAMDKHRVMWHMTGNPSDILEVVPYCGSCGYLGCELETFEHQSNIAAEMLEARGFGDLEDAWDGAVYILKDYAEDQSMAGAYFPEWETTARLIGSAPDLNPYRKDRIVP